MQTTEVVAYMVGIGMDWSVDAAAGVPVLVGTGLAVRVAVAVASNVRRTHDCRRWREGWHDRDDRGAGAVGDLVFDRVLSCRVGGVQSLAGISDRGGDRQRG